MSESMSGVGGRLSRAGDLAAAVERQQQLIHQQQLEIEALVELLIDKRVTSLGEFKAHMVRMRQRGARSQHVHDALMAGVPVAAVTAPGRPVAVASAPAAPAAARPAVVPPRPVPTTPAEEAERRRYTL